MRAHVFCTALVLLLHHIPRCTSFLVSAREYVCTDTAQKLVIDAWSIKDQQIYIRMNHYTNTSLKDIDQRLIVYDLELDRFLAVFHPNDKHSIGQAEKSTHMSDVISLALIKSFNEHRSPSALYFDSRVVLRNNCHKHWFYDPPHSGFCRRHSVTLNLGRTLAMVNQMSLHKPDNMDYDLYRLTLLRVENFGTSIVRPVHRWTQNPIQDTLSQLISTSTLALQLNHNNLNFIGRENVRFLFSNKLGLFFSWLPSNNEIPPPGQDNCAILLPVKLSPTIRICSKRYSFVSIVEMDPYVYIVIPENRVIHLSHDYLNRQFRIYNNLEINLDQSEHEPYELFESIFRCSNNRKLKSTTRLVPNIGEENTGFIEEKEQFLDIDEANETLLEHQLEKRHLFEEPITSREDRGTAWYWYYLAPIGTYLVVSNSLLLVIYIVEKDWPRNNQIVLLDDEKQLESRLNHKWRRTECTNGQSRQTADILRLFRLTPAETCRLKSSIMEE